METLHRCGYEVEAMEKYSARDDRPRRACEADVAKCDIYVGVFAWMYGFVPEEDNSEGKSITELEYLAAGRAEKPRLVFLLADDAPWPSSLRDAEQEEDAGKRIRDLRKRLKAERWTAFFKSPDDLAREVLTAIVQTESTKRIGDMDTLQDIQAAAEFGPSFLTNLQQRFAELSSTEFIAIRLGPTVWWDTRLHLASALASDFTEIRQFVILDDAKRVLVVSSPLELRRALTKSNPLLEMVYLQCRNQPIQPFQGSEVDSIIFSYPITVQNLFGQPETNVKKEITAARLRELGIKREGEVLERSGPGNEPFSNSEIMRGRERYVVLVRNGNLQGVLDRVDLSARIAAGSL